MLKAAIIGAGHIARQHLACLNEMSDVEVVGLCDLSPAMAESTADRFGVSQWFTNHKKMLDQARPNVVHVATPPQTHFMLAMDAINANAHVVVEKPITTNLADWIKLRDRAQQAHKTIIEDHNYLFNENVQQVLSMVDRGDLGEVVHVEVVLCLNILGQGSRFIDRNVPHPSLSLPGGAIGDFLTHLAYLAYAFAGPHKALKTVWDKRIANSPLPSDEFRATIRAERATASLLVSAHSQPDAFYITVFGTKLRAQAHLWDPRLTIESVRGRGPLDPLLNGLSVSRSARRSAFSGIWRKLSGGPASYEGLWELLRRTYRSLGDATTPPVLIEQIDHVNRLVADLTAKENQV